jgi:ubiquinone/menaquinone biosynthesis C-methylase UbiE
MREALREQFEFEKSAAKVLMSAGAEQRPDLYKAIYLEFYQRFGQNALSAQTPEQSIKSQTAFIRRFIRIGRDDFFEIGSGSGDVCVEIAKAAKSCIGVDPASTVRRTGDVPPNCSFLASDIVNFQIEDASVDVAFSNQVLEHLHPEDCQTLIGKVFRALRPGGIFVNIVPNKLSGPHDVSKYFAEEAEGLHLHEYSNRELSNFLGAAGFVRCTSYMGARGAFIPVPAAFVAFIEDLLSVLPRGARRNAVVRAATGIRMTARKPRHAK